jgi:hypothetical protein
MYTFQALADISTTQSHYGFYLVGALAAVLIIIPLMTSDDIDEIRGYALFAAIILTIAALVSWNTGEEVHYANKQVNATLVGFQGEVRSVNEGSGKTLRSVDKHNAYVIYAVPDGNIMFPAASGQVYPRTAVLYRN